MKTEKQIREDLKFLRLFVLGSQELDPEDDCTSQIIRIRCLEDVLEEKHGGLGLMGLCESLSDEPTSPKAKQAIAEIKRIRREGGE